MAGDGALEDGPLLGIQAPGVDDDPAPEADQTTTASRQESTRLTSFHGIVVRGTTAAR